jgi:hypothetical protein
MFILLLGPLLKRNFIPPLYLTARLSLSSITPRERPVTHLYHMFFSGFPFDQSSLLSSLAHMDNSNDREDNNEKDACDRTSNN